MISGQVTPDMEAVIPVFLRIAGTQAQSLDAIIDTGFSGHLSLPLTVITALRLRFSVSRVFSLGNNARANFDLYEATVVWDGQDIDILVLATDAHPLVGMSLLKGYRMTMDTIDGGQVRIEPIP